MKKFLVLFNASVEAFEEMSNASPEDQKEEMNEWKTWMDEHKDDFVDAGSPLSKNLRVTKDGVSSARNEVGGYSVMQAESAEELAKMLFSGPHLDTPDAYIEIMELVDME